MCMCVNYLPKNILNWLTDGYTDPQSGKSIEDPLNLKYLVSYFKAENCQYLWSFNSVILEFFQHSHYCLELYEGKMGCPDCVLQMAQWPAWNPVNNKDTVQVQWMERTALSWLWCPSCKRLPHYNKRAMGNLRFAFSMA